MGRYTPWSALTILTLALACDREPTGMLVPTGPSFQASHEQFSFTVDEDVVWFVPCANDGEGENLHFLGPFDVRIRISTSSTGNRLVRVTLDYREGFVGLGLTSGDEWVLDPRKSQTSNTIVTGPGGAGTIGGALSEFYTNQNAETLHIQFTLRITIDANGNVRGERIFGACVPTFL